MSTPRLSLAERVQRYVEKLEDGFILPESSRAELEKIDARSTPESTRVSLVFDDPGLAPKIFSTVHVTAVSAVTGKEHSYTVSIRNEPPDAKTLENQ